MLAEKKNESCYFSKTHLFRFRFQPLIFVFQKRLICIVNDLEIKGFYLSLTDSSVNFQ